MSGNKKCGQLLRPHLSQEIFGEYGENREHLTLEHTTHKFPKIRKATFWKKSLTFSHHIPALVKGKRVDDEE